MADADDRTTPEPPGEPVPQTLWHGRMSGRPADDLMAFTASLPFDIRLAAEDIEGSRAHVRMLAGQGIIEEKESSVILAALDRVAEEIGTGAFAFAAGDEDVHTAVERRVTELAGPAGAKLHTARSRNDQVALDLRLFVRREGGGLRLRLVELLNVLAAQAEAAAGAYLPGYTHLQRAQPVPLAHHLLAHFWSLTRDVARLDDALARADVSPLGAGALAGTSLPVAPDEVARSLGFANTFANSLDAVADRDFVAELLFVAALTQVHLSRLGEEIVIWSTEEFGFVTVADEYATGSSMLPQKKNPDIAELARGKAGRLIGNLTGFLATLKGLPLAYNRDLQEDKEPLFDAFDTLGLAATAMGGLLSTATWNTARMQEAADDSFSAATDLAEFLVRQGIPFREAHALVGNLVRQAVERGVPMEELVITEPWLGPEALELLEPGAGIRNRTSPGGASMPSVKVQLAAARELLASLTTAEPET